MLVALSEILTVFHPAGTDVPDASAVNVHQNPEGVPKEAFVAMLIVVLFAVVVPVFVPPVENVFDTAEDPLRVTEMIPESPGPYARVVLEEKVVVRRTFTVEPAATW